jgi:uncharacterized protein YqjF (DUF2071 family)
MVQRWADVVFVHWRIDPAEVARLLPEGVTVDTFDGSAWVGLVPFSMQGLGFPRLAPLPLVGAFPEVNVRTYVRAGGRRGVWFCSLDVDRVLPVAAARAAYRLPYCVGDVDHHRSGNVLTTSVARRWPAAPGAHTSLVVRTGDAVDASVPLHRFLTARWGLIAAGRTGRLTWAPVEHPTWPLHAADVLHLDDGLVAAAGLHVEGPPALTLWSPGVPVRIGRPTRLRPSSDRAVPAASGRVPAAHTSFVAE